MTVTAPALLRFVAIVALLQGLGHAAMFARARPTHGPAEVAVVDAMRKNQFKFAAAPRSYWDMYFGYGFEAAAICFVEAVLFWQLAAIAGRNVGAVKPIAGLFIAWNLAHIALLARYFAFPMPMVFDALIAVGLFVVVIVA